MGTDKNDIAITDKSKMDELLKLLEELVINKIRIERIKQELQENEYKKVLGQEIEIVSKVQDVVKKIQTSEVKVVYSKLAHELKQNAKSPDKYHFSGDKSEFDNNLEPHIFNILKTILETYENSSSEYIAINAYNSSSNIIIEIANKETSIEESKDIYSSEHISLTYANELELKTWLDKNSISGFLDILQKIKSISKMINAYVELECEGNEFSKITFSVPNSSSITKAQFIKLSNQTFAIPVEYIDKIIKISAVKTEKTNGRDFIKYMDHIIPIIHIDKKLDMVINEDYVSYIVLSYNGQMKTLPVNFVLEQSDIVVRPKPQAISEIVEFKGTAILEDGNVTIVLDVPSLIQVRA